MPAPPSETAQAVATWPQIGAAIGAFVASIVVAVLAYLKKGKQVSAGSEVAVISATFADKETIKELSSTMGRLAEVLDRAKDHLGDEAREARRCTEENTSAMKDLAAAIRSGGMGATPEHLIALIDRLRHQP